MFKILNGYEDIDSNIFIEIKESKITRGHNFTLVKKQVDGMLGSFLFHRGPSMYGINYQRSVYPVHASSVNMFKNRIDKYIVMAGYTYNKGRLHLK